MRAATSEQLIRSQALGVTDEWRPRAKLRFDHPNDVVDEPTLGPAEKRAVLSSWASDASAVRDEPELRWLLGTPGPVRLDDIRKALLQLDNQEARQ
jgi:hypothetical protein